MSAWSSSARNPIDTTRSSPSPTRVGLRHEAAVLGLDRPVHAEQPRQREPADVGVDDADDVAEPGERDGEVRGDRRLADATLARADGEHRAPCRRSTSWARGPGRAGGRCPSGRPWRRGRGPPSSRPRRGPRRGPPSAARTSRSRRPRSGQATVVSAIPTWAVPSASTARRRSPCPRATMSTPSSGSTTPRRRSSIAASSVVDTGRPYREHGGPRPSCRDARTPRARGASDAPTTIGVVGRDAVRHGQQEVPMTTTATVSITRKQEPITLTDAAAVEGRRAARRSRQTPSSWPCAWP